MSLIISKNLNDGGARFVNAQLQTGGLVARAVLDVRGPVTRASAPLPEGFNPGILTDFQHGGVTSLASTIDWLISDIAELSRGGTRFLLVVEDNWLKPSDIHDTQDVPIVKLTEEEALIYVLDCARLSASALTGLFEFVRSFSFCGFFIDYNGITLGSADGLSASKLAKHAKRTFVSAFDREGVVIGDWTENESVTMTSK